MYLKKHFSILLLCLLASSIAFAQKKYPKAEGNANKNLSPAIIDNIQKSYKEDVEKNIRVSDELMEIYRQKKAPNAQKNKNDNTEDAFSNLMTRGSKIRIHIIAASVNDLSELTKTLAAKGLTNIVSYENSIDADIEVNKIASLEEITSIMMVKPIYKPATHSGAVQTQVDRAIRSDIARTNFGVNGNGIKIGILSDSYNALGGAVAGVAAGELPGIGNPSGFTNPIVVLKDLSLSQDPGLIDEGRGMAEIVHDVAPGAQIYFYTAFDGPADFAAGIRALANAGCKIIVDDVSYFDEPFFQDGILAKAVEDVSNLGVSYFTIAGNSASRSYEFNFKPTNFASAGQPPLILHNFSSDPAQPIDNLPFFCPVGAVGNAFLQWSQPFKSISGGIGARTDLDIFILDNAGNVLASNTANNIGEDPSVSIGFLNISQSPVLRIAILKRSGVNTQKIKIRFERATGLFIDLENTPGLFASTITGQANARSAITLGAADYRQTTEFGATSNIIQDFSSKGGTDILFNRFGGRIFDRRLKPEIVAADNGNTSFFGEDIDNDGLPNFSGTSASAPLAAAIAALGLEASHCVTLSPLYVKNAFIISAEDMDDPETPGFDFGFDFKTGFGYINAEEIVGFFDFCSYYKNTEQKNKTTTSIEKKELDKFSIVSVSPNPTTNIINISINGNEIANNNDLAIKILDISGKQIPVTPSIKGNVISINVQALVAGTYIVQINKSGKIKNTSFIKQ